MSIEEKFALNIKNELIEANLAFENEMVINCQIERTLKELESNFLIIDKVIKECNKINVNAYYPSQIKERCIKGHTKPRLIFFI